MLSLISYDNLFLCGWSYPPSKDDVLLLEKEEVGTVSSSNDEAAVSSDMMFFDYDDDDDDDDDEEDTSPPHRVTPTLIHSSPPIPTTTTTTTTSSQDVVALTPAVLTPAASAWSAFHVPPPLLESQHHRTCEHCLRLVLRLNDEGLVMKIDNHGQEEESMTYYHHRNCHLERHAMVQERQKLHKEFSKIRDDLKKKKKKQEANRLDNRPSRDFRTKEKKKISSKDPQDKKMHSYSPHGRRSTTKKSKSSGGGGGRDVKSSSLHKSRRSCTAISRHRRHHERASERPRRQQAKDDSTVRSTSSHHTSRNKARQTSQSQHIVTVTRVVETNRTTPVVEVRYNNNPSRHGSRRKYPRHSNTTKVSSTAKLAKIKSIIVAADEKKKKSPRAGMFGRLLGRSKGWTEM